MSITRIGHFPQLKNAPIKQPCVVPTWNYGNHSLSGTGTVIDGYTIASGDRILVTNQSSASANGIYVAASGSWTRDTDLSDLDDVVDGALIPITKSDIYKNSYFIMKPASGFSALGTSDLNFYPQDHLSRLTGVSSFNDFYGNSVVDLVVIEYATQQNGGYVGVAGVTSDSFGQMQMDLRGVNAGNSAGNNPGTYVMVAGSTAMEVETRVKFNGTSDGTETYYYFFGFSSNQITTFNANGTDMIGFLYDTSGTTTGSAASTNWQYCCIKNNTRTFVTSSNAVSTSWTKLKIIISTDQKVYFYIDDVLLGNISTNVPFGNYMGFRILAQRVNGSGNRIVYSDYVGSKHMYATNR